MSRNGASRRVTVGAAVLGAAGIGLALCAGVTPLGAQTGPTLAPPGLDAGAAAQVSASCTEFLPKDAPRPEMKASLPERGLSGYEARLEVVLKHGGGETVLPEGFHLQRESDSARAIERAGFVIPEPDGGASPRLESKRTDPEITTTLSLPFVPLPKDAGRHVMVLPPIPIAVARANGEVMTLCTEAQSITVDDPIANEPEPKVKPNPPPRPQREDWPLARQMFYGALVALALGALLGWLLHRWLNRPKVVPAPPRVLPWIAALCELDVIRRSSLLEEGRTDEHFDRVDDCLRFYLGQRYGFDGLESTTEELRALLGRVRPKPHDLDRIFVYLGDGDLIKYADLTPTRDDCLDALERAERIVRATIPAPVPRPAEDTAPPPEPRRAA
jgi:hypothetical protein